MKDLIAKSQIVLELEDDKFGMTKWVIKSDFYVKLIGF